jgi:glycosyltransferase involved in cell wall biosynthesis
LVELTVADSPLRRSGTRRTGLVSALDSYEMSERTNKSPRIIVVVPTKDRPTQLREALSSVYRQTIRPYLTIVVGQRVEDFDHSENIGESLTSSTPTLFVLNTRTANLSGAVNTAMIQFLEQEPEIQNVYVAVLDDDDWWEPEYLERCFSLAREENLDWVVAGIIRHESEEGRGVKLAVPCSLTASAFLRTNPHVQGSNLFLRLPTLLKAGCYDENLQSTTDRDLGVRLVNLGNVKVGFMREHLVHHRAYGQNRLSVSGSPQKRAGLVAFYQKYAPLMSAEDREKFLERATRLFGCHIDDFGGEEG